MLTEAVWPTVSACVFALMETSEVLVVMEVEEVEEDVVPESVTVTVSEPQVLPTVQIYKLAVPPATPVKVIVLPLSV